MLPTAIWLGDLAVTLAFVPNDIPRADAARTALSSLGITKDAYAFYRTPWGQPRLRHRPGADRTATPIPLLSFSDDGLAGMAIAADPSLRGLGLDIVRLDRLSRYSADAAAAAHLLRRISAATTAASPTNLASIFALKEATAKALGTGLKVGLGLGGPHSVPFSSIEVSGSGHDRSVELHGAARTRLRSLGAHEIRVATCALPDYVIGVVGLIRQPRNRCRLPDVVRM